MIKFIQLPQDQALGASDDLWILSETKSSLFLRMNWLLNFQLTAALRHKTPTISKEIEEILSKCELRTMSFSDEAAESPIWLIGSMSHLPCKWIMLAPLDEPKNLDSWWKKVQQRIISLRATHVRLYATEALPLAKLSTLQGQNEIRYSLVQIPPTTAENITTESLKWI